MKSIVKIMFVIYYFTENSEGNNDSKKEFTKRIAWIGAISPFTFEISQLPRN